MLLEDKAKGSFIRAVAILYLSAPGAAKLEVPCALSFSVESCAVPAVVSVTDKPTM